jgi:hypothetical protein
MAELLGLDMGRDVNRAHDNLLFTLLFKRPRWAANAVARPHAPAVRRTLDLFEDLSRSRGAALRPAAARALLLAATEQVRHGVERQTTARRAAWVARRLGAVVRPTVVRAGPWGWKEPTAHLLLPQIIERFPGMRYVHVMRDPRDYAAKPHNQPLLWGGLLGVRPARHRAELVERQLAYWATANQRALQLVRAADVPHHVVRLEEMSLEPERQAVELAAFLGIGVDGDQVRRLADLVSPPETIGRGARIDLSAFDTGYAEAAERLGYPRA